MAIRSVGSVESVTFVNSSGVAAIGDAIRRVVYSQTPDQGFPPGPAREFAVIEIRRTWYFDMAIRLHRYEHANASGIECAAQAIYAVARAPATKRPLQRTRVA